MIVRTIQLISCDHGSEMETSFPRACGRPNVYLNRGKDMIDGAPENIMWC